MHSHKETESYIPINLSDWQWLCSFGLWVFLNLLHCPGSSDADVAVPSSRFTALCSLKGRMQGLSGRAAKLVLRNDPLIIIGTEWFMILIAFLVARESESCGRELAETLWYTSWKGFGAQRPQMATITAQCQAYNATQSPTDLRLAAVRRVVGVQVQTRHVALCHGRRIGSGRHEMIHRHPQTINDNTTDINRLLIHLAGWKSIRALRTTQYHA